MTILFSTSRNYPDHSWECDRHNAHANAHSLESAELGAIEHTTTFGCVTRVVSVTIIDVAPVFTARRAAANGTA